MSNGVKLIEADNYLALQKVESLISITKKLLQNYLSPAQQKLIEFLIENSEKNNFTIELLSKYFPFTKKQLEEFKELLDWSEVGRNENLLWNYDLIYHFKNVFFDVEIAEVIICVIIIGQ